MATSGNQIGLLEAERVEIITLCENFVDVTAPAGGPVKRVSARGRLERPSSLIVNQRPDLFEGAHGLSLLVRATVNGVTRSVLFDAGGSVDGLVHNLDCMEMAPGEWNCIVLSHGHGDHAMGLVGLQQRVGRLNVPLTIHPDAFLERGSVRANGEIMAIASPSRRGLADAGIELIETEQPSLLLEGSLLVTGQIARTNDYETGWPAHRARRNGEWEPDPLVCDDQALVRNLKGKGLVVLSGCGHAGIMNTVSHAQALTGVSQVHAVMGGFNLGPQEFQSRITPVVEALTALNPALVAPAHCTGYRAACAIYRALPVAFVQNTVGTQITLIGR
ncbi:MAG: MBL fold metallo-hydrolase [Dehalococcoidia bacterium]|nr:MBL fold metallo-hydrolase [Dehalococcoidia bacterium]